MYVAKANVSKQKLHTADATRAVLRRRIWCEIPGRILLAAVWYRSDSDWQSTETRSEARFLNPTRTLRIRVSYDGKVENPICSRILDTSVENAKTTTSKKFKILRTSRKSSIDDSLSKN